MDRGMSCEGGDAEVRRLLNAAAGCNGCLFRSEGGGYARFFRV
ncbi:hypothetical protein ACTHPH_07775 [Paenibacillus pasadenensis]|nr:MULTISPECIES: hypothetical protein [Paenibacillus]